MFITRFSERKDFRDAAEMGLTLCDFRSISAWLTLCACLIFLLRVHAMGKPQAVKMALLNFNLSLSEK